MSRQRQKTHKQEAAECHAVGVMYRRADVLLHNYKNSERQQFHTIKPIPVYVGTCIF